MSVTIQDVAKQAEVSVATVSRVMNGNYPVKQETKERVLAVIKELNYIPNMQARELTTQQSTTIGVIVPSINNMFFTEIVNGIDKYIGESNYSLMLTSSHGKAEQEQKCISDFLARNVLGIIIVTPNIENIENKYYETIANKIPIVFVNFKSNIKGISSIYNDEEEGAKKALEFLYKNKHRKIMFVRGEDSYSYDIKEKVYREFMSSRGVLNEKYIINIGKGNSSKTVDNTCEIFLDNINKEITAVFACNDLMAVGIINGCKKKGIDVPKDISIIGFDNIPLSKFIEPKLTTVDQNMFDLGNSAIKILLDNVSNNNKCENISLGNKIIIRETVKFI